MNDKQYFATRIYELKTAYNLVESTSQKATIRKKLDNAREEAVNWFEADGHQVTEKSIDNFLGI